ncbi:glycosyltransferase [Flavihumibacter sp. ZG627]|uniref:glycosyltransferase n=1 Tax=Flavihumibacter sp. ZG627 TaxID=1463156 RepID=UPI000694661A|nr:glycosyltransferase [Flavihumibacter sp. ZG627]
MTQFSNFPSNIAQNTRILVSPLDWGLGHATRCIPLIDALINRYNARITVAAEGAQRAVIQEAFPSLPFLSIPGYQIKYHKNRAATIAGLALSLPRIVRTIELERQWLTDLLRHESFDHIISDNRYGLWHPTIPSYLLTHQLLVKTAFGSIADRLVQRRLYKWIDRFTECWVPDYESEPSLGGKLSHPKKMPAIPVRYMGPLSRLKPVMADGKIELLAILSGPEPQRSLLEKKIREQWEKNPGECMVMVQGLPGGETRISHQNNLTIYNHVNGDALSQLVANASMIVCRSGYSSMMDLLPLGKDCVVVPTPGQTEQEYLVRFLASAERVRMMLQKDFDLASILQPGR